MGTKRSRIFGGKAGQARGHDHEGLAGKYLFGQQFPGDTDQEVWLMFFVCLFVLGICLVLGVNLLQGPIAR